MLAPTVWHEIKLGQSKPLALLEVEVVEPYVAESLPAPPRLDAYVPPDLTEDDLASEPTTLVPETFAVRFGQLYAPPPATAGEVDSDDSADMADVQPPSAAEDYVGRTHGEPADVTIQLRPWPTALASQLETLAEQPQWEAWVARTTEVLRAYVEARSDEAAAAVLEALDEQSRALGKLVAEAGKDPQASLLRRVRHALARRVDVWKASQTLSARQDASQVSLSSATSAGESSHLAPAIAKAEQFLSGLETGSLWVEFLLLPQLREAAVASKEERSDKLMSLVRRSLARYQQSGMTVRQRLYLRQAPLVELKDALLRLTDQPVDVSRALAKVEAYEASGLPSDAEEVADAIGRLTRSVRPDERELGRRLSSHYRGTNLRLAVSEELLTRFLPRQKKPTLHPVQDTILGVPVSGQSLNRNALRVRLVRTEGDIVRLALESQGTVESQTSARSGPVSTSNRMDAEYLVSKMIDIEADGLRSYPPEVHHVQSSSQLQCLETDWDGVPLIGDFVRSMANSQYQATESQRQQEVEYKLRQRIETQFERQAAPLLSRLNRSFTNRVLVPLSRLDLESVAVIERPADERLNTRFRVASDHQLSAHTPRPRALAGSLASVQVHESFFNNVLGQLRLDGRTMNAKELVNHLNRKLNTKIMPPAGADAPPASRQAVAANLENAERLSFTFAPRDALRVRLAGERLLLMVKVARLEGGSRRWNNFEIIVPYGFTAHDATIRLAQADELVLKGRLSNRSQIIIRGILTNFFDSDAKYDLLADALNTRRLGEVHVAQIEIIDGWLGLSMMRK
jgi:hypothetical protein